MKQISRVFIIVLILCLNFYATVNTEASAAESVNTSLGNWTCWDDGTIDPCHNTLNSVSMTSINDGWSVGENGIILHWDGQDWIKTASPTISRLNAVASYANNDGWAVGDDGIILHWNGSNWSQVSSPTSHDLQSISIVSSTNAWIVGWVILHWDGNNWDYVDTPNYNSQAIAMVPGSNGSDGWAVGYNGSILHWNSSEWIEFDSPTTAFLYDVSMISSTDGWIVGNQSTILHWDGSNWEIVDFPGNTFASIWEVEAYTANDAWAIGFDNGGNSIYHWNGTKWLLFDGNGQGIRYNGLTITPNTNGTDAWIVGSSGYILELTGNEWIPVNEPYTIRLFDIQMLSAADGWLGGTSWPIAMGDAFHWNGVNWIPQIRMDTYGLDFLTDQSGTIGWSVGVWGDISKWDGTQWSSVYSPSSIDLISVDIISREDAWAVGLGPDPQHGYTTRGVIAHYVSGEWITVTLPTTSTMVVDVSMVSPTDGWAVGGSGTILNWQGSEWQIASSPTVNGLASVKMLSAANGWIIGSGGTILHWDGVSWEPQASPTSKNLSDVEFYSSTDGWAVGAGGAILHWDGISWQNVDSPTLQNLNAIAYSSPYELWAVGINGIILHYEFNPILTINYSTGAPGSFFTLTGSQYPADSTVNLMINGYSLGMISSDSSGNFNFILATSEADEGIYNINASINPDASARLVLDNESPVRPKEGDFTIFAVPAGIAYTHMILLPMITK